MGGPGAEVTRIVTGPFLSYHDFWTAIAGNGFILQREIPGPVQDWQGKG